MTLEARASDGERHIITFADGWKGEMRLSPKGSLLIKKDGEEAPTRYDPRRVDKIFQKKHGALTSDQVAIVRKKKEVPEPEPEPEEVDLEEELEEFDDIELIEEEENNGDPDAIIMPAIEPEKEMPSKEENIMLQTENTNFNRRPDNNIPARPVFEEQQPPRVTGTEPMTLPRPQVGEQQRQIVPSVYSQTTALTVIQETISIEGNINAKSDVRINGIVRGNVNSTEDITITGAVIGNIRGGSITIACNQGGAAKVTGDVMSDNELNVGAGSLINGDITAKEAVIQGAVKGSVNIEGRVILDSSAIVLGDIKAGVVVMNEGMKYSGKVVQTGSGQSPEEYFKSVLKEPSGSKDKTQRQPKDISEL